MLDEPLTRGTQRHLFFVLDLRGVDEFRELIRLLERRGCRSERIEKILGGNFLDYADRVWAPEDS
ncbi:hypothetical protein [Streptomyces sp. R41]|uniref:Uncharacterized protein n=1 Tax=Streptomyces sp. R41 TaxID=3238632 RepID=A0AB39R3T1_9ACTN